MALAKERKHVTCRSLLMVVGAVVAGREPPPLRMVRGCIAMSFTAASVRAVASRHRLVDAVKGGGELSYVTLAMEREHAMCRSVLTVAGAAVAGREPPPLRMVRGCIAMSFTAGVRAVASRHRRADAAMVASSGTWHSQRKTNTPRTHRYCSLSGWSRPFSRPIYCA